MLIGVKQSFFAVREMILRTSVNELTRELMIRMKACRKDLGEAWGSDYPVDVISHTFLWKRSLLSTAYLRRSPT
jgi:hypothetical protein